jgi:hypothetical protein
VWPLRHDASVRVGGPRWFWRTFILFELSQLAIIAVAIAAGWDRYWAVAVAGIAVFGLVWGSLGLYFAWRSMWRDTVDPIDTTEWERRWFFRFAMLTAAGPFLLFGFALAALLHVGHPSTGVRNSTQILCGYSKETSVNSSIMSNSSSRHASHRSSTS